MNKSMWSDKRKVIDVNVFHIVAQEEAVDSWLISGAGFTLE